MVLKIRLIRPKSLDSKRKFIMFKKRSINQIIKRFVSVSFVSVLLAVAPAYSAIYYIDFANGNDNNSGTSTSSAWKTIPGTRSSAGGSWVSGDWGPFDGSNKVPGGTTFRLRPGRTHDSSTGGQIWISSHYYRTDATLENPVRFEVNWPGESGAVTFDGSGVTMTYEGDAADGLIHMTIGGIVFDGMSNDGMVVRDSKWNGIASRITSGSLDGGSSFKNMKFINNGTSVSSYGQAGSLGQLRILSLNRGSVENCEFDGGGQIMNGIMLGESRKAVQNFTITDCVSYDHDGDDDEGFGYKVLNGQISWYNSVAYGNFKGWDLGVNSGEDRDIMYKLVNCTSHDNSFGVNFNGVATEASSYGGDLNFYLINCIIRDNREAGSNIYEGPFDLYMIHNVYENNGWGSPDSVSRCNILITPDYDDTFEINVYMYNNIFYKPGGGTNFLNKLWEQGSSRFNVNSDYNSWVARAGERFCQWSYYIDPGLQLSYGSDGPGHKSGKWYDYYGSTSSAPSNGAIGHHHADGNSKGTGADDPTGPPFTNVANNDFTLTGSYDGIALTSMGWYTSEMGVDRLGNVRGVDVGWDIGAYGATSGPRGPVAIVSVDSNIGEAPFTVSFDGSESFDPDGNITSYEWDFDDDGSVDKTGVSAQNTYSLVGTFTARLTVTDNDGMSSDATVSIEAYGPNTLPVFSPALTSKSGEAGTLVQFTISATDTDGDQLSFPQPTNLPSGASFVDNGNGSAAFSWRPWFDQTGSYPVTFSVSDGKDVVSGSITIQINASSNPPTYSESFSNGTSDWQLRNFLSGSWSVISDVSAGGDANVLKLTNPDNSSYNAQIQMESDAIWTVGVFSDFTLELVVRSNDDSDWKDLAVAFCYDPDANTGYLALFNQEVDAETNSLFRLDGTARLKIDPQTVPGLLTDENYHVVKIIKLGSGISVYWDGSLKFSATDFTYTSGMIALGSMNDSAMFDNIVIWSTPSAPPGPPGKPTHVD
jgi:PKD domain/Putative Ig domain